MKSEAFRGTGPLGASWVLVILVVVLSGCRREEVNVYHVPKGPQAQSATATAQPNPAVSPQGPALQWKAPANWKEMPAGEMRLASFRVEGPDSKTADVSVVPLAGFAGGDVDNVNRWRGQVGMEPVVEAELSKLGEKISVDGTDGQLYDLDGKNPGSDEPMRVLAAVVRREGVAWFFKMTGDSLLVGKEKPGFVEFLKSIQFSAAAPDIGSPAAPAELPAGHPPIGSASSMPGMAQPSGEQQKRPAWQVPAAWKEVPAGQFLIAKFAVAGPDNAQATINISMSVGDGGGVAGNVNRWRGQLGLPEVPEAEIQKAVRSIETVGGKASLVELAGADARSGQKASLVAVIVSEGGRTWFYKLMGNEQIVDQEKTAFTSFVQTAKY